MDPAVSRRQLLRGRFFGRIAQAATTRVEQQLQAVQAPTQPPTEKSPALKQLSRQNSGVILPIHRPPGAIDEAAFLQACTKCDDCIRACPHQAIIHAPPRFAQAEGTPMIHSASAPCHMCPDTPCITACTTGALRPGQPLKMGTAVIQGFSCLAHRGSPCAACVDQCPVEGAMKLVNRKPLINEQICTGCGLCHRACPAPQNAIVILPLRDRPAPSRHA